VEGLSINEVPELELTEEGKYAGVQGLLCPLEGLRRRGGLEVVHSELESTLDGMNMRMEFKSASMAACDISLQIPGFWVCQDVFIPLL